MSAVPEPAVLLELTGVTRYFDGDPDTGIHDVNLRIYRGEFIAILGPSGAGKSTLLNILGLLDIPDAGIYRVDGIPVGSLPERARDRFRSRIFGFMFQQSFILGDSSALDNAGLGLRTQHIPLARRRARAHEALARLGVDGRAPAAGRVLSGGEQQRVALARAIATRPEVLLADEPTGNLDRANGAAVLAYLHELNAAGMTVILITHDENIAATATRQIRVEDGTVLAGAPPGAPLPSRPPEAPAAAREGGRLRRRLTALADDLGDALNVLTTRAGRTLFLLLAFTLGIGGLITSLGIGESASAQVSQRLSAAALDEVRVAVPGGAALLEPGDPRLPNWLESAGSLPHVRATGVISRAAGSAATITRLAPTDPRPDASLSLVSASASYLRAAGATSIGPDTLSLLDDPSLGGIAILGSAAAEALELPPPGPGSTLWVNGRLVDVVGVLDAGPRQGDLADAVIVSPDVLRGLPDLASTLLVRTEPGYPAAVAEALPARMDPANPGQFGLETVADLRELRYGVATDLGSLIALISAVLLLLAAISAACTMYVSVQARGHEIALRRAVGAGRRAVATLFLGEGVLIGLSGGAVGIAAGTAATLAICAAREWTPVLAPWLPLAGLGLGLLSGLFSAAVPAWAAGRQRPAATLRAR